MDSYAEQPAGVCVGHMRQRSQPSRRTESARLTYGLRLRWRRLTIATTQGYTTVHGISVKVTTSELTAIGLHGGASASGDGFRAQSLALNLSGGAHLDLSGEAKDLEVEASGGAVLQIGGLKLTTARVDLSGGVVATMSVSSALTGKASGGVVINLDQRPPTVDVQTSGGAVVLGS